MPEDRHSMRSAGRDLAKSQFSFRLVVATVGLGQGAMNASSFLPADIVLMGIPVTGIAAWIFDLAMRAIRNGYR